MSPVFLFIVLVPARHVSAICWARFPLTRDLWTQPNPLARVIQTIITSDSVASQSTQVTSAVITANVTQPITCITYPRQTRHFFWNVLLFPTASCWAFLRPTAPIWRNWAAHLGRPRTHGGFAQCDTTWSSRTDFVFKVWEDHGGFRRTKSKKM